MRELPLHVQVLQALHEKLEKRLWELQDRTGNGLEPTEYQRHVGRIAELKTVLTHVKDYAKQGTEYVEQLLEDADRERQERRATRRTAQ